MLSDGRGVEQVSEQKENYEADEELLGAVGGIELDSAADRRRDVDEEENEEEENYEDEVEEAVMPEQMAASE